MNTYVLAKWKRKYMVWGCRLSSLYLLCRVEFIAQFFKRGKPTAPSNFCTRRARVLICVWLLTIKWPCAAFWLCEKSVKSHKIGESVWILLGAPYILPCAIFKQSFVNNNKKLICPVGGSLPLWHPTLNQPSCRFRPRWKPNKYFLEDGTKLKTWNIIKWMFRRAIEFCRMVRPMQIILPLCRWGVEYDDCISCTRVRPLLQQRYPVSYLMVKLISLRGFKRF